MEELSTKELVAINGGGPVWKLIGYIMGEIDDYVYELGKESMAEVEAGNYVAD